MVLIFALIAANPFFLCGADRICIAANELRGRYSEWTQVVSRIPAGAFDVREKARWRKVEKAFEHLRDVRKEMRW